jgi:hypothetical protein
MDQFCDKSKQIGFSTGFPRIRPAPNFFFASGKEDAIAYGLRRRSNRFAIESFPLKDIHPTDRLCIKSPLWPRIPTELWKSLRATYCYLNPKMMGLSPQVPRIEIFAY